MERWQAVTTPNIHLATMRVYNSKVDGQTRISLFLPDAPQLDPQPGMQPQYDTTRISKEYALDMVNQEVENHLVISERDMDPPRGRAKATHLMGQIHHECNIRPKFDETYRSTVQARTAAAKEPKRKIVVLGKQDVAGGQGALNKLSSGAAPTTAFDNMVKTQQRSGKEFERFARIPRNQLLDMIFRLFEEQPSWSFKDLRTKTEQPAEYLKVVLQEVASLHRSGELNGQWTLLETFQGRQQHIKDETAVIDPTADSPTALDTNSDDVDDDEDMEEIQ